MKSDLPILLISGKDDAIGNYGKGIRHLGKLYKRVKFIILQYIYTKIKDMKYYLKKMLRLRGNICMIG